jgi:hypothetical protein
MNISGLRFAKISIFPKIFLNDSLTEGHIVRELSLGNIGWGHIVMASKQD